MRSRHSPEILPGLCFTSILTLFLVILVPAHASTPPDSSSWEAFRAAADTLRNQPGATLSGPPSFFDLQATFDERLRDAIRMRLAGNRAEADSAVEDCRLAAYLASEVHEMDFLSKRLDWGLALSPEMAKKKIEADSLLDAGVDLWNARDFDGADVPLGRARDLFNEIGDTHGSLRAEMSLITQPIKKIPMEAQAEGFARMAERAGASGDLDALARCVRVQGCMARTWKDWESSIKYQRILREVAEHAKDPETLADAFHFLGASYGNMERIDSCLYYQRKAIDIALALDDTERVARVCHTLCLSLWELDEPEKALQYCEQAMAAARETERWWEEENAANIIGNIYGGFDAAKSLAHYQRADSIACAHNDYVMRCYATSNTGIRWLESGDQDKAQLHFERALVIYDSISSWWQDAWDLKGEPLLYLGRIAWDEGDTSKAIGLVQEAVDWAYTGAPSQSAVSIAAHDLAHYRLESGDLEQADSLYQLSLDKANELGSKYYIRQGYAGLAEVAWQRGEWEKSIAQLDRSIEEIESMREALGSLEFREQWFASELWSYELMIRHRIEMGEPEEALAYFERMKARELLDLMTGGHVVPSQELSDVEQDEENRLIARIEGLNRRIARDELGLEAEIERAHAEYDAFEERLFRLHPGLRERRGKGRPLTPDEARRLLDRDEVALLYALGPEHAALIVVTRDGARGHVLKEAGPAIRSRVQWLSDSIHSRSGPTSRAISGELFRILVGPAEDIVRDKKRICVVPDGELYSVPFQALVDPESGSYLIEDHPVYVAPSLSALASMRGRETQDKPVLLAFGDPYFSREERPGTLRSGLAPLPFSGREVESIADVYRKRAKVVTGPEASESVFKTLAPDYNVIHIASHGLIDDRNPMHSSIAFSEADSVDDGFLEAREVMKMDLNADIVVLSACETARGRVTRGEGVKGLLRSFFVAGVPTVVASLWPVEDESTALLMSEFHRQLRKGKRPADAMAAAQRTLLKSDPRFRDSYYWAGFLVYGDSR